MSKITIKIYFKNYIFFLRGGVINVFQQNCLPTYPSLSYKTILFMCVLRVSGEFTEKFELKKSRENNIIQSEQ